MKRVTSLFLIFLLIFTCLIGCHSEQTGYTKHIPKYNGNDTSDNRISEDDVLVSSVLSYDRQDAAMPDYLKKEILDPRLFYTANGYFYAPIQYQPGNGTVMLAATVLKYDTDGALVEEIAVPGETYHVFGIYAFSDGRFLLHRDRSERGRTFSDSVLQIVDRDGSVLKEVQLPPFSESVHQYLIQMTYRNFHVNEREDGSARILVNAVNRLYYYDEDLTLLSEMELPSECAELHMESDGVYMLGCELPHLYRADLNASSVVQIETLPIPPEMFYFCKVYWDIGGTMYCTYRGSVYCSDENEGQAQITKLLDWMQGTCTGDGQYWMLDRDCMVYLQPQTEVFDAKLYILHLGQGPDTQGRQILKLADLSGSNPEWILELVDAFNRENEGSYVQLISLSAYRDGMLPGEQLKKYLMENGVPDMVIFHHKFAPEPYIEKGMLLDLRTSFGDRLLGCAADAVQSPDGGMYLLPMAMQLDLYASAQETQSVPLTWDPLYSYEEEIVLGESDAASAIFTYNAPDYLYYNIMGDFIDFGTKTVSFDSEEFIRRIEFLDRVETTATKPEYGTFMKSDIYTNGKYAIYGGTGILSAIRTGEVKLLNVLLNNINAYASLKFIFGDTPFTLCGYPTESGNAAGADVDSPLLLSVFDDAPNTDCCMEFLEFVMQDEVQTSDYLVQRYLPVTRSAMETAIDRNRYFAIRPMANNAYLEIDPGHGSAEPLSAGNDSRRTIIEITDADKQQLMHFFDTCETTPTVGSEIMNIINEELAAWKGGVRSLSEAAKLIQSRVWIYVNE